MIISSDSINKIKRPLIFLVSVLCVLVLSVADYYMHPRFSFLLFFLFPVCFATWWGGRTIGITIAVLSAAAWIISDIISTEIFTCSVISYWNMTTNSVVFLVVSLILSNLKKALRLANDRARTDPVTSTANRRAFSEFAGIELYRINRYKRPFTIAYLDLDDLKQVSEKGGFEAGDELLHSVAGVLRANIRSSDFLSRLSGDTFAILLTETNEDQAKSVIEKLSNSLQEAIAKEKWEISFNIGVVTYIRPPATVDEMLKKADHMTHAAKREGKNRAHYLVWRESAIVR